jgi:selenocysteine lyase/cysteine desulfurase
MKCQKELFSLNDNIHYLNCAYKAPLLKSAEAACLKALAKERNPVDISINDFFEDNQTVRMLFAELIHATPENIALIPSTSYGFASVLNNIAGKPNGDAVTIQDEFPSGYFALKRWCAENANELIVVSPDNEALNLGASWNANILAQITEMTSVVLISSVHWMNGIKFDLEKIGQKCHEVGAKLIVDGTQSVGALQMDVERFKIHALVCASYKWMFGPYSVALAYISEEFCAGKPLEETWINKLNSDNFGALTNYEENYEPHARRFNVGETSNFILMPMLKAALQQLLAWNPVEIELYCKNLIDPLISYLKTIGVVLDEGDYFSSHLFSLQLPASINLEQLKSSLLENKIYVSFRGNYIRVSVNVFNDEKDIKQLIKVIQSTL